MPLLGLGIYLLMLVVPRWDPRRENYARFLPAYRLTRAALVLFTAVLQGVVLAAGLGRAVPVGPVVQGAVSFLFLLIGNQLGRVRPNYFFGIRTPWTLASEEVWRRTHRLGAWLLVGAGLVGLASAPLPAPFNAALFFGGLAVALGWSILYSYLVFRRLRSG
ncbi:MAG: SdpI family protein [Bacillota bacterium]|nr:SdpI family protein [Bacillota bacterium]